MTEFHFPATAQIRQFYAAGDRNCDQYRQTEPKHILHAGLSRQVAVPQRDRNRDGIHEGDSRKVVPLRGDREERHEESDDSPNEMKCRIIDKQMYGQENVGGRKYGNKKYRCGGFNRGSGALARNQKRISRGLPGVWNPVSHADDHDESRRHDHPCDQLHSTWIWGKLAFEPSKEQAGMAARGW